ncbi:phosphotyrosine-specific ptp2-like protein [Collariella sp. IMI 366227]|nr:phosphotyrosine-specific ptp2-like protein [Collariella sp. IMI 366227]
MTGRAYHSDHRLATKRVKLASDHPLPVPNLQVRFMMPPEQRVNDRPSYYTMKTPGPVPAVSPHGLTHTHTHTRSTSQSYLNGKPTTPPVPSPKGAPSAGQPHQPKLSPGTSRGAPLDARTPSPNYFGLSVEPNADPRDSCMVPRENWSSPSSSVKSFAAAIPKQLPLDANPDFEAFRKQIDANRARAAFNLTASHFNLPSGGCYTPPASTPSALQRPRPPKWHTQGVDDFPSARASRMAPGSFNLGPLPGVKLDRDADSLHEDSAYVSADSKRSSSVSLNPPFFLQMGKPEASPVLPPKLQHPFPAPGHAGFGSAISRDDARPSPQPLGHKPDSSSSVPATGDPSMISPSELKELLEKDEGAGVLLLDLRVSPQFAQSRIRGALNLCIPTTLLKRATFNLQKLQQTFQGDQDQDKFANWRETKHLVVYDASSSDKRDAVSSQNMIKKFTNEGYSGPASILRGGFNAFAAAYPDLVDRAIGGASPGLSLSAGGVSGGLRANLPPVIGGVLLPNANDNPTPFFNHIRQNQDLVDGVGQMDVGVPAGISQEGLPRWLRETADTSDHGKKVCIEKGVKNRYKDILPFEHARVKLGGRQDGACDYVNASHLHAKRTYKRYIASQGPLPATFEDFWSVIWDNDVRVIVMLTAESEGGQLKCHPYWKGSDFGPIRLRVLSEKKVSLDIDRHRTAPGEGLSSPADLFIPEGARRRANTTNTLDAGFNFTSPATAPTENPYVIIRKFALSHAAHPFLPIREITQLHYPSWPDFGAPAQPSHLLALVELANVMQRGSVPLDSVTTSRKNSEATTATTDGANNSPFFSNTITTSQHPTISEQHTLKRTDSDALSSLSWNDGPEPNSHPRPMLVHCSAGCGRTGAFCTVDSVIDMLKRQRQHILRRHVPDNGRVEYDSDGDVSMDGDSAAADDRGHINSSKTNGSQDNILEVDASWLEDDSLDLIAQTVEDFRGQRLSMVQSLRQFVLCYETVLEWIRRLQESGVGVGGVRGRSGSLAF